MKRIITVAFATMLFLNVNAQKKANGKMYIDHPAIDLVENVMQMFVNGDENLANFLDDDFKTRSGVSTNKSDEGSTKEEFLNQSRWMSNNFDNLSITRDSPAYPDAIEYKDSGTWVQTWERLYGVNKTTGFIHEMAFGNGGTSVDPTGIITYLTPNSTGSNATLYNQTYYKVIDDNSATNKDTTRNKMEVRHTAGNKYTDIVCTCTLDYGEPTGQAAFDNTTNFNGDFVFDELGLKSFEGTENGSTNKLLTHVIFHPVQKSLNRLIQIDYTLRIQSLTTFTETSSTALSTSNTVSGTTSGGNTGY